MRASALDLFAERGPRSWQQLPKQQRDRAAGTSRSARLSVFYRFVTARALPALLAVGPAACENRWRVDQGFARLGKRPLARWSTRSTVDARSTGKSRWAAFCFSRFHSNRSLPSVAARDCRCANRGRAEAPLRRSRCPLGRVRQRRARVRPDNPAFRWSARLQCYSEHQERRTAAGGCD